MICMKCGKEYHWCSSCGWDYQLHPLSEGYCCWEHMTDDTGLTREEFERQMEEEESKGADDGS